MFAASKTGKAVAAGAATDPYFNQTVLLLNDTGTNGAQNNTFIDSSTNNFTITRNGNATQGSVNPYQPTGYWSNYFDGTGDYLDVVGTNGSANFTFGTGNVTIECWVYHNSITGYQNYYRTQGSVANAAYLFRQITGTLEWYVFNASGSLLMSATSATGALVANTWYHIAAVRSGNTHTFYVNGQASGTPVTASYSAPAPQQDIGIGREKFNLENMNGYISNHRVVKGTAVYTANFTPSTLPLTAISGTVLLTCQDNRFKDNSSNNYSLTSVGNTATNHFNPLPPTASYSGATYGGSGYFDGTGDYLNTSGANLAAGTGDFTWECWVYVAGASGYQTFIDSRNGTTNAGLYFGLNTGTLTPIIFNQTTLIFTSSINIVANAWNHVALVRNSGTIVVYINGVSGGSLANSYTLSSTTCGIGSYFTSGNPLSGYLSNIRVVNGTAVYTSAFTPPTAPVTAITNTQLLLNATNAGIYDATALNDMETVGNAQVSTTQYKWGASSMKFDGTGDWLLFPNNVNITLNQAVFTIEGWIYLNAVGSARGIVGKGTGTTGWLLSTNSSNQVVFTDTTTAITSTGTLSVSTWYHIAVVRSGTGTNQTKIYINGTNDGTGTSATNFSQTNSMYVGADRTGGSAFNGYIEDLRVTKGIARYTANFTAPTAAFPTR